MASRGTVGYQQSLLAGGDELMGSHLVGVYLPEESEPGIWKRALLLAL